MKSLPIWPWKSFLPTIYARRSCAKIKLYVASGVKLVWLVDPETQTVIVYKGTMRGTELDETDTIDGDDVLPGFSHTVAELFG